MKDSLDPAKRDDSIKPGWSEAKPQVRCGTEQKAHEVDDSDFITSKLQLWRCRTLRALGVLPSRDPGVPLRSTPGFMLLPATRVLKRHVRMTSSSVSGMKSPKGNPERKLMKQKLLVLASLLLFTPV